MCHTSCVDHILYLTSLLLATDGIGVRGCDRNFYYSSQAIIGPILMTIGPWKPIRLHTYSVRITDVDIRSTVSESLDVHLKIFLSVSEGARGSASVVLRSPQGIVVAMKNDVKIESGKAEVEFNFPPGVLELWYPVGYGKQPIYTVDVQSKDQVSYKKSIGNEASYGDVV